jgi:hypothetical protein
VSLEYGGCVYPDEVSRLGVGLRKGRSIHSLERTQQPTGTRDRWTIRVSRLLVLHSYSFDMQRCRPVYFRAIPGIDTIPLLTGSMQFPEQDPKASECFTRRHEYIVAKNDPYALLSALDFLFSAAGIE